MNNGATPRDAHAAATGSSAKENVFLFVPNLIGYARVVLAVLSLLVMTDRPLLCVALYCVSCLLDAVDGNAARYFDQCSRFGAVLDMVTDRSTTTCMLCYLATAYPQFAVAFQLLISLDFSSHYMHMYSSLVTGAASHKLIAKSRSAILRAYYSNNNVLFLFCAGNELYFVALYLLSFVNASTATVTDASLPAWLPVSALYWLAYISFPICAGKQLISVIQMVGASRALADKDIAERAEKRLAAQHRD
ncbi:CDP-alcohol phosphatidyltransferase-domain-containing protein [Thamnocephalis sphaerospora]|uniref:CDP-diacylglycerol--inositol 3-phosphatidyltransferase n=1 Tax=Thamnocephalis sphaerospora TaxID=78915 RepID=A0A4P9XWG6_9FUNG|nr:CDP-alcohol phosphatidyltransferase-domain-containing protein [Thamnocephalis sphaerospora]|eukprot:RKP09770.1 CDP-alcohol phosphatidyltransferase-domain-containing protein [Thamnocephalis sphaerospora]